MLCKINKKVMKYNISSIAIKIPSVTHQTTALKELISSVQKYCTAKNILYVCTIKEFKAHSREDGKMNKALLIQALVDKYPQLYLRAKKRRNEPEQPSR